MDGYTVAKAAAAKAKAAKKTDAPPATAPPEKAKTSANAKAKVKGKAGVCVVLQLAPNESQAEGDLQQTAADLQGLATEQAFPAHPTEE